MRTYYFSMLLALVLSSCTAIKQEFSKDISTPSLGAIGKQDKSVLNTNFKQVGEPVLTDAISVAVKAIPFSKTSFKSYTKTKAQKGEKVYVNYVDSLPIKPKYLQFEIKDKIGLKTAMNQTENLEVRNYVSKDSNCQIVSQISVFIDEMEIAMYTNAQAVFLSTDNNGLLQLELVNGRQRQKVNLDSNEIFDYKLVGFCWGENNYGKSQIETLNTGKCPEGKEKSAKKSDDLKSFLKL